MGAPSYARRVFLVVFVNLINNLNRPKRHACVVKIDYRLCKHRKIFSYFFRVIAKYHYLSSLSMNALNVLNGLGPTSVLLPMKNVGVPRTPACSPINVSDCTSSLYFCVDMHSSNWVAFMPIFPASKERSSNFKVSWFSKSIL